MISLLSSDKHFSNKSCYTNLENRENNFMDQNKTENKTVCFLLGLFAFCVFAMSNFNRMVLFYLAITCFKMRYRSFKEEKKSAMS